MYYIHSATYAHVELTTIAEHQLISNEHILSHYDRPTTERPPQLRSVRLNVASELNIFYVSLLCPLSLHTDCSVPDIKL